MYFYTKTTNVLLQVVTSLAPVSLGWQNKSDLQIVNNLAINEFSSDDVQVDFYIRVALPRHGYASTILLGLIALFNLNRRLFLKFIAFKSDQYAQKD